VQPICTCFTAIHFHKLFSPFWLPKGKMLSGFAILHPGQRRVPLLVWNKHEKYYLIFSITSSLVLNKNIHNERIYSLFFFLVIYTFRNLLQILVENFITFVPNSYVCRKSRNSAILGGLIALIIPFAVIVSLMRFSHYISKPWISFPGWIFCSFFFKYV